MYVRHFSIKKQLSEQEKSIEKTSLIRNHTQIIFGHILVVRIFAARRAQFF